MSGDSGTDPEVEKLKEAIEASNRAQRRRHTENIHMIFASVVVGSFFTQPFQEFITTQGLIYSTNIFVSLSVIYIIVKLSEITLRESFHSYILSIIFGFLSPLIYVVAVFGYLIVVFSEIIGFSGYITIEATRSIIVMLFVISVPYALFEFKKHIDTWKYSIENSNNAGERFEKLLKKVPSIIESGLTLNIEQPMVRTGDARLSLDYIGEDAEGNTVLIEAKTGDISAERAQYTVKLVNEARKAKNSETDRVIIVHTGKVQKESKSMFDEEGIELQKVNPYSAYGILGNLFKFIDGLQGNKMQN